MTQKAMTQKGSAYMLVAVVMLIVFLMTAVLLNITGFEMRLTHEREGYETLYDLAVSGANLAARDLNGRLREADLEIEKRVQRRLQTLNWNDRLLYKDGYFHTRTPQGEKLYADYYQEEAIAFLREGAVPYVYTITLNSSRSYQIEATWDSSEMRAAARLITSASETPTVGVIGHMEWNRVLTEEHGENLEELFFPSLAWRSRPVIFSEAIVSAGIVTVNDEEMEALPENETLLQNQIRRSVLLLKHTWTEYEAVAIIDGGVLDVSEFYDEWESPVPTCVIAATSDLLLTASRSDRTRFAGVIYAAGNVYVQDISVQGNLFSMGNVFVTGTPPVSDENILFQIPIGDWELQKSILDFFGVTDFGHASNNSTDIAGILKDTKIFGDFTLRINSVCDLALSAIRKQ